MSSSYFETVANTARILSETDGLRTGCAAILGPIAEATAAQIAFVVECKFDSSSGDLLAAHGLAAVDFRRLEARITRSGLWQITRFAAPVAIDDMRQDAALDRVGYDTVTKLVIAVPITLRGSVVGLLAVGFAPHERVDEAAVIQFLTAVAAMIAQNVHVERILSEQSRQLADENLRLQKELKQRHDFGNLIGNSGPMRQVFDRAERVSKLNAPVLIRGEAGTGKSLLASAIHYNSLRSKRPFIEINCSALTEENFARKLFGDDSPKPGFLARADRGTLLLNEIGALPPTAQLRLAQLLSEGEVNVRLIASTDKALESAVDDGEFREDLYHRLRDFALDMPPLRERRSDILLLAEHFVDQYAREHGKEVKRLSTPAIDMLVAYHFPGNVRELENVIKRAVITCDDNVIHGRHLPPTLQTAEFSGTAPRLMLVSAVEAFESDMIQDALKSTRGNVAKAAKMLDSTERILGYKIRKYGIEPARFRGWKPANN